MGRAFLDLYSVTGDRQMLQRAEDAAAFIARHFVRDIKTQAGLPTMAGASPFKPQYDENVTTARFGNLLFRYTRKAEYRSLAECAMRYLATPAIGEDRPGFSGGILIAAGELSSEPLHVTVIGPKGNPLARELFATGLRAPLQYKMTEWLDPAEGKLPYQELEFPTLPAPAAFLCANGACSTPLKTPEALAKRLPHAP
jgi:hypothetical protein